MRITSSIEYATRLAVRLGRSYGQEAVSAEKLSQSENVPADYINQLLLRLKRAGLVESHRGTGGGYALSRPPADVRLAQIVRAVEGRIVEDVCERYSEGKRECHHQDRCGISPVWQKLAAIIEDYLESVSLAQLLEDGEACGKMAVLLEKIPSGKVS